MTGRCAAPLLSLAVFEATFSLCEKLSADRGMLRLPLAFAFLNYAFPIQAQTRLNVRSGLLTQERPTRFCLGFSPYNEGQLQREEGEMESEEIEELSEAKKSGEKEIGLTMAIVAVLLAFATTMGHRTHTEEVLIQTKANDQWAYHQAKNIRSHMYEANSEMARLIKEGASAAEDFRKKSEDQKQGAEAIRVKAEDFEREVEITTRRAGRFDTSEIFLEIAIVLCSITLLTGTRAYWRISFVSSATGIIFMVSSFLIR